MFDDYSSATVTDCVFLGNTANYGGAMANLTSSPSITNSIFTHNQSLSQGGGGGMYNVNSSKPVIAMCTFT